MINVEKIKINMLSGSSLEKPLISAFKSNNAIYVVLDNEINGTMGLPIILVSKLENNKLIKIVDQNEWGAVKETLRMIIAGNQVDYVIVDASLGADDMFFSQLTLPVASFEALKNNYRPNADNSGVVASDANVTPVAENIAPVENANPEIPVETQPIPVDNSVVGGEAVSMPGENVDANVGGPIVSPEIPAEAPVANEMVNPQSDAVAVEQPALDIPIAPIAPETPVTPVDVTPVMPSAPADAQSVAPVSDIPVNIESEPVVPVAEPAMPEVEPGVQPASQNDATPVDFTADKEAFLKACENMFDALVSKFKN